MGEITRKGNGMKVVIRQSRVDKILKGYREAYYDKDSNRWDDNGFDNRENKYNHLLDVSKERSLTYEDCVLILGENTARNWAGLVCDICNKDVDVAIVYEEGLHQACDYKDVNICRACLEKSIEMITKETV